MERKENFTTKLSPKMVRDMKQVAEEYGWKQAKVVEMGIAWILNRAGRKEYSEPVSVLLRNRG